MLVDAVAAVVKPGVVLRRALAFGLAFMFVACGNSDQTPPPDAGAAIGQPFGGGRDVASRPGGDKPAPLEKSGARSEHEDSDRAAPMRPAPESTSVLRKEAGAALTEYRQAFEARDLERLGHVWRMTAIERALIEGAWANCEDVTLSIDPRAVRVDDDTASIDFDQRLEFGCPTQEAISESHLLASLVRRPNGKWVIVNIAERPGTRTSSGESRQAVSAAPSGGQAAGGAGAKGMREHVIDPASRSAAALMALEQYETALEQCDLTELARVWIMNPLERQILEGVCYQYQTLSVSITGKDVAVDGNRAQIDFTQSISYRGKAGSRQTKSALTALMIRRTGGEWAIWKIRESNAQK